MSQTMVRCAKLKQELPAIDDDTIEGEQALKMCRLIGGRAFEQRVRENVSWQAWKMWIDHQVMVVNEFRLDPTSDAANPILLRFMEAFFFAEEQEIPNYVPPAQ